MIAATLITVLAFSAVHAFTPHLRFLDVIPRSRWLSMAGGVSVAYVFVHLLPELAEQQNVIVAAVPATLRFLKHHVWLIALTGLVFFFGVERAVRRNRMEGARTETNADGIFLLHMASFTIYNILTGYLMLTREISGLAGLFWYTLAMSLHFFVTDFGLLQDHREAYRKVGRWVLVAAVICGWALGMLISVGPAASAVLTAFLAGGVILNVLKEELPEERNSRFSAFLFGAAVYAALLLIL